MHTEEFCPNLADLDPVAAIRAIHEAYCQFVGIEHHETLELIDNRPVMASLRACLRQVGHPAGKEVAV